MDPNQAYKEIVEAIGELINADDDETFTDPSTNLGQLVHGFIALDEWLSNGGFLPERWTERFGVEVKDFYAPLPDSVRHSVGLVCEEYGEYPIGWKPIRQDTEVVRFMVITNKGRYEFTPDGLCVVSGVLHKF